MADRVLVNVSPWFVVLHLHTLSCYTFLGGYQCYYIHYSMALRKPHTLCSSIIWSCLGLFPFVPTFLSSTFLTSLLLLFLCLLIPRVSSLLFPCERYTVWNKRLVYVIPVPVVHARWSLVFRGEMAKRPKRCYRSTSGYIIKHNINKFITLCISGILILYLSIHFISNRCVRSLI